MATAWIKIFILTFAECVAPAGKTVCQEQQFELQFLGQADCEYALQQLIAMKDEADHVIVNRQKSGCAPSAVDLLSCEETGGVVPCKIGDIIVEEATGDRVEIWKQD